MNPPILVLILAGARGDRLHALGRLRTASALPYGGKYRVIDFALSNCVHSGLYRIGVLTQYAPLSLHGHIGIGRAWDLDRRDGGIRLLPAYVRQRETNWYRGTADALVQNRNVIEDAQARHILVISGDLVAKVDFARLIERHEQRGAALTIVTAPSPAGARDGRRAVRTDGGGRVLGMPDEASEPGSDVPASIYLFQARELRARLEEPGLGPDLVHDVVEPMIAEGLPVVAQPHDGYWRQMDSIEAYYEASMELLAPYPALNLHDPDWLIYTPSEDRAPAIVAGDGDAAGCLMAHGCRVEGTVRRSILFPGVHVSPGAVVEDSIVMHDTRVLDGARVSRAIVDKAVRIGKEAHVGGGDAGRPNREYPADLASGLAVIGKRAEIPAGSRVGPNTLVDIGVRESDFAGREAASGSVVRAREKQR
ncbi:MAG TPA: sugar phosphate nucleotidyltransferase [Candidatus Limnocylindrales bacterium]|nr:sugar phosphate nucleotidyltransferase [Candidatus Limnocylindrales bacterium]